MDDGSWILIVLLLLVVSIIVALILTLGKSKEISQQSEANIMNMVRSLPTDKQTPFLLQINSVKKSPTTAVLL
ncbi:MAG: hypothetical protein ABFD17_06000, partial [Anaerolineaceae bacterium]